MLNQLIICGRLTQDPETKELENGRKGTILNIAVQRPYKNAEGVYDTDFIDFKVYDTIAENIVSYCKKGDLLGIKGRIQTRKNDNNRIKIELIAEKVTFLSSKKED